MKLIILVFLFVPVMAKAQIISTVAGNGTAGYSGDGAAATVAECYNPFSVATDHAGNFYITDGFNYRIRKVSASGIITTVAGTGVSGYSGDGGAATSAAISGAIGIAADAGGNLYIADNGNARIRKIDTGGIINTIAGTGSTGYGGDGGPAIDAALGDGLWGIAFDDTGNILFADYSNSVIRKINTAGIISVIAGNSSPFYSGDGGPALDAGFVTPHAVAADAAGNIYVADYDDNRVRKINTTGIISTFAGNGDSSGTGYGGYSGDGGLATAAELYGPDGLAIDAAGNVFIADMNNHVVRKVDTAGIISTVVGTGIPGYSGDGGVATAATLFSASGIALDNTGDMYIADMLGNRIRKVSREGVSGVNTIVKEMSLSIYPDPVVSEVNITASEIIHQVSIANLLGQTVYSGVYNAAQVALNVSGLQPGVYSIKINGSENRKFIKL